jgi:hypothetical protein
MSADLWNTTGWLGAQLRDFPRELVQRWRLSWTLRER